MFLRGFTCSKLIGFQETLSLTFNHILDKELKGNALHSLILKIKNKQKRQKAELQLEKLRKDAQIIISHSNKVIAHHETDYNSKLGDYYPAQPYCNTYVTNP
jgi:hypothetical protein